MEQSDMLRSCTGELWTEMHKQNLALDSLEHEVLLLEAQNNSNQLYLLKQDAEARATLVDLIAPPVATVVFTPKDVASASAAEQLYMGTPRDDLTTPRSIGNSNTPTSSMR